MGNKYTTIETDYYYTLALVVCDLLNLLRLEALVAFRRVLEDVHFAGPIVVTVFAFYVAFFVAVLDAELTVLSVR